jgi:NADH dehydrogenase
VAQVALQQGRYVGAEILRRLENKPSRGPFRYMDIGSMAVIGRGYAILEAGSFRLSGFVAWLAWAFVHINYLAEFGNRIRVFTQWAWSFFTAQSGSRLIVEPVLEKPQREM